MESCCQIKKIVILIAIIFSFGAGVVWITYGENNAEPIINGSDEDEPTENEPIEILIQRGKADENLVVEVYDSEKAYNGTTLLYDKHDESNPRIIEVNMYGEIVWEYAIDLGFGSSFMGVDAELTDNDTILIVLSGQGVFEVNRDGEIVWAYYDPDVSHDADRLENGNTLVVFGNSDDVGDAQVKEINQQGEVVWEWYAKDHFEYSKSAEKQGWTHTNGVQRLSDGSTMISLRNFYLTIIVDSEGDVIKEYDWSDFGEFTDPHDPEMHEEEGTLLVCLQLDSPYEAVEVDADTGEVIWALDLNNFRTTRDCDRLPNGNTLIVGVLKSENKSAVIEVTPNKEIVWRMILDVALSGDEPGGGPGYFYKAERIVSSM